MMLIHMPSDKTANKLALCFVLHLSTDPRDNTFINAATACVTVPAPQMQVAEVTSPASELQHKLHLYTI